MKILILGLGVTSAINLIALGGVELGGLYAAVNDFGPPFAISIVGALLPWSGQALPEGAVIALVTRQAVWLGVSLFALVYAFTRRELAPPPSSSTSA